MTKNEAETILLQFSEWLDGNEDITDDMTHEEIVQTFLLQRDLVAWPTIS